MSLLTVQCPNCGANLKKDKEADRLTCHYCGSQVNILGEKPKYLELIKRDLTYGNHQTEAFRDRLNKAIELHPDNQDLFAMQRLKVWEISIQNNDDRISFPSHLNDDVKVELARILGIESYDEHIERIEVGQIILGTVVQIAPFGAMVELIPETIGLLHITNIADHCVKKVEKELAIGDKIYVKVVEIDPAQRINLTRKGLGEKSKIKL